MPRPISKPIPHPTPNSMRTRKTNVNTKQNPNQRTKTTTETKITTTKSKTKVTTKSKTPLKPNPNPKGKPQPNPGPKPNQSPHLFAVHIVCPSLPFFLAKTPTHTLYTKTRAKTTRSGFGFWFWRRTMYHPSFVCVAHCLVTSAILCLCNFLVFFKTSNHKIPTPKRMLKLKPNGTIFGLGDVQWTKTHHPPLIC